MMFRGGWGIKQHLITYQTIILIIFGIIQKGGITTQGRCTHAIVYRLINRERFSNFQNVLNSLQKEKIIS